MKLWILFNVIAFASAAFQLAPAQVTSGEGEFKLRAKASLPFNAGSCAECHAAPTVGGSSKITVSRTGRYFAGRYVPEGWEGIRHAHSEPEARSPAGQSGLRVTMNLLGDEYVEAIPELELHELAASQATQTHGIIHGYLPMVTLPELSTEQKVVGRFGWKDQHGSLLSAAAEALRNELGVPNVYYPAPTAAAASTHVPQAGASESREDQILALVAFLRSTEPIGPDLQRSALSDVRAGSLIFGRIGCSICHVRTLKTAPPGTQLEDGAFSVTVRLGNQTIHPYGDFLLHDVGTGDGIVQNIRPGDYDPNTANKFRTPPLWGVRFRSWMMHDGKSVTYHQAIMRHGGEATGVVDAYRRLTPQEQNELREFLNSL